MSLPIAGFAQNIAGQGLHGDDLKKLILKLKWIGMSEEAERLQTRYRLELSGHSVFIDSPDTD